MPRILFADYDYPDLELETELFRRHGIDVRTAHCRSEDDVIAAARDCFGILLQYAPITERVIASLPQLSIVSRIGAGFDTVDTEACAKHGVWVANSPDYGIGEVATHALALALAMTRNIVAYHRDITGGNWHFLSSGPLRRPRELTLGIVGLGRIGKRMAHIARETFKRVVAFDPYLIDGDFPTYVERVPTLEALARSSDVVSLHTPLNRRNPRLHRRAIPRRDAQGRLSCEHGPRGDRRCRRPCSMRWTAVSFPLPRSMCCRTSPCRASRDCSAIRASY